MAGIVVTLEVAATLAAGPLTVDVELEVGDAETLALLGPNGAGKSTLLDGISGLRPLETGRIALEGEVLVDTARGIDRPPEERSVGRVFQDLLLFPHLDALANVAFPLRARGQRRAVADKTAHDWVERLGVDHRSAVLPGDLSGGEAQRIALARALAARPRALLLDEPLSALDADQRGEVRRTLRSHLRAHHRGPCLLVTHDPLDAAVLADRVVVLEEGRITASGSFSDLVARPRSAWAAELAGTNLLLGTGRGTAVELADGGVVTVAEPQPPGPVLVSIRPAAVALHRAPPEGSARNVWAATVAGTEGFGERVRVQLQGAVPLVAEVTAAAVAELDLRPGASVWATVKATEVVAYPG
jgi:molybdate transport system ATP-binding protein